MADAVQRIIEDGELLQKLRSRLADLDGQRASIEAEITACVQRIVASGCRFYGYDSFIVDGHTIQPVMEFSPDWSEQPPPPLEKILSQLSAHPSSITHYEFVFEDADQFEHEVI